MSQNPILSYNTHGSANDFTVVSSYVPSERKYKSYQTEYELERDFLIQLQNLQYEYLNAKTENELIINLRKKLEELNPDRDKQGNIIPFHFTDLEWSNFFNENIKISGVIDRVAEKTRIIQTDCIKTITREDGSHKNIKLIDKHNLFNNKLQVINQYHAPNGKRRARYDVTILVNGLPLVHVELKKRGVSIRNAFEQIERYIDSSFSSDCGLFEWIQIFVISNGTSTKYYSNTVRKNRENEFNTRNVRLNRTSHSFEFTSFWSDGLNKIIDDLEDFSKTFLLPRNLLKILFRYSNFNSNNELLVLRPYQIYAIERIGQKIQWSIYNKLLGTKDAGGYIWHTMGSGKTLTSFKAAQLISDTNSGLINYDLDTIGNPIEPISKVLFTVDRNDLDYQTMKEYDKFEKGAANGNTSTKVLEKQLNDPNVNIIVTTIQKLSIFVKKYEQTGHSIFNEHVVIMFDECQRSQFGEMHKAIAKNFKKYHIFGFTGTPIFTANATKKNGVPMTTDYIFGERLHTYNIVDAINDCNVLPLRVDYVGKFVKNGEPTDVLVSGINNDSIWHNSKRLQDIVDYILDNFDRKTYRNNNKIFKFKHVTNTVNVVKKKEEEITEIKNRIGFNSLFSTDSIPLAIKYYGLMKNSIAYRTENNLSGKNLKVAMIYSKTDKVLTEDFEYDTSDLGTDGLERTAIDALKESTNDYNQMFGTSWNIETQDGFQNFYKDVSLRMKNGEIDILIVVNMFLTGFDAPICNTLWVDRFFKDHGLIQSFSRTIRILNAIKRFGNIVCFRNLQKQVEDALALFGDKDATGVIILKSFEFYYEGSTQEDGSHINGYVDYVRELQDKYPLTERLIGENAKKDFIRLYGQLLKVKNILSTFDEFSGREILSERDFQDYQSRYIDLYHEFRNNPDKVKEDVEDEIEFEIELVKQVEANLDYILELVAKHHSEHCEPEEIIIKIIPLINSSIQLRNKKDLIEEFIRRYNLSGDNIAEDWHNFIEMKKEEEIMSIISEFNLDEVKTRDYIKNAFRKGYVDDFGPEISKLLLGKFSRFSSPGKPTQLQKTTELRIRLKEYFDRYFEID